MVSRGVAATQNVRIVYTHSCATYIHTEVRAKHYFRLCRGSREEAGAEVTELPSLRFALARAAFRCRELREDEHEAEKV